MLGKGTSNIPLDMYLSKRAIVIVMIDEMEGNF